MREQNKIVVARFELHGQTHNVEELEIHNNIERYRVRTCIEGVQLTRITPFLHRQCPQQSPQEAGREDCHVQH